MVFSALSGPGHLHLTFSFSTSGHVKGKMHAWSLWEALWLTSSLLFSCTQSCKGLQDTYLWWWHASAQRNSTKFPFRLTLYPTANPLEPLHRAHYPDAHEGRPHHLFRATWAELAGMPRTLRPLLSGSNPHGLRWWSCHTKTCGVVGSEKAKICPSSNLSGLYTLAVNVLDLLIFHCLLFKTQDLTWSSQCCLLPLVELCILPRTPSSLQGFGFIGTHFNDITEASWSAANLQCRVAEPWPYRHTDNELQQRKLSWQEHLGSKFWACDTNCSSLKIQIHLGKHLPSSWQVSQAAFCKTLKKSTSGGCTPRWHFKEIVSPAKSCWDRKLLFWTIICTAFSPRKLQCLIGWHHLCKSSESLHQSRPSWVFGWMCFTCIFHVLTIKNETWII